ncbi:hypothetical protein J2Z47_004192 [Cohnella thailandensis]|nr:hypothetical protein [Cohnella thailandensis]
MRKAPARVLFVARIFRTSPAAPPPRGSRCTDFPYIASGSAPWGRPLHGISVHLRLLSARRAAVARIYRASPAIPPPGSGRYTEFPCISGGSAPWRRPLHGIPVHLRWLRPLGAAVARNFRASPSDSASCGCRCADYPRTSTRNPQANSTDHCTLRAEAFTARRPREVAAS